MAGKFKVVGTLRLSFRECLVIYGDIVEGNVAVGEVIDVPLNSSLSVAFPIESVEAVDGTPTGSHVGLLVADDKEIALVEGLNILGDTLAIHPPA
jgi:hypothetical protein